MYFELPKSTRSSLSTVLGWMLVLLVLAGAVGLLIMLA
jgi:hypothetical protein